MCLVAPLFWKLFMQLCTTVTLAPAYFSQAMFFPSFPQSCLPPFVIRHLPTRCPWTSLSPHPSAHLFYICTYASLLTHTLDPSFLINSSLYIYLPLAPVCCWFICICSCLMSCYICSCYLCHHYLSSCSLIHPSACKSFSSSKSNLTSTAYLWVWVWVLPTCALPISCDTAVCQINQAKIRSSILFDTTLYHNTIWIKLKQKQKQKKHWLHGNC